LEKSRIRITLTDDERIALNVYSTTGNRPVRLVRRARVILALDTSNGRVAMTQIEISAKYDISRQGIIDIRNDFLVAKDVDEFLRRKKRETPPAEPKITGDVEARIIALRCGEPPVGYARWTLRLLAEKCVELNIVDELSHMSVQRLLKKTNLNLT